MARKITDKPNALPVSGTYPYGDIKDNSGSGDGVPVNRVVYADFHQFFARIADLAGVILNSLPDNAVNGWQFVTALQTLIANAVAGEASIRTTADTNLNNIKVAKAGDSMSGALAMGGNKITGLGTPTVSADASTKSYVDSGDSTEASIRSAADTSLSNSIAAISGGIQKKEVNIGDWDILSSVSTAVAHGLADYKKIRSVKIIIRDDTDVFYTLDNGFDGTNKNPLIVASINSTNINIGATTALQNTNYDSTSYNRGFLIIEYAP